MSNVNIHFDYGGSYSTMEGDEKWNCEGQIYGLSFRKTVEEITYSVLVGRICRKICWTEGTARLKLSYIPLVVRPPRHSVISDDEDVYVYLTSIDKDLCRSVLHVELMKDLEIDECGEQLSRAGHGSSAGVNYRHMNAEEHLVNDGAIILYGDRAAGEQEAEVQERGEEEHEVQEPGEPEVQEAVEEEHEVQEAGEEEPEVQEAGVEEPELQEPGVEETEVQEPTLTCSQYIGEWEDGLGLEIGQEFESRQAVQDLVDRASFPNCFRIRLVKSDLCRLVLRCRQDDCNWFLRVSTMAGSRMWGVKRYRRMHTCSRATASTSSYRRKCTPRLVASVLHEDYPGNFATPTPKGIMSLVQGRLGLKVSYSTTLRGKKQAVADVRGSPDENYKMLYCYLHMLEKVNLGTKTSVAVDEESRFKYFFVALGASMEGFKWMRKVLIVDATFLTTVYSGVLIFATAQDPNHHHYPIAFGVLDGDKEASWNWFFNELKTVIPDSPELVFTTDRNVSLMKAVRDVYPNAQHGYCLWHLSQNVRSKVANVNKDTVAAKFRQCGKIYSEVEFLCVYGEFKEKYPSAAKYVDDSADVKKWARCYFPGEKYNIDSSNAVESMNGVFRKARKYSLLPMIDTIIEKFSEWFNAHRKEACGGSDAHKLVHFVENVMHNSCKEAHHLAVVELNSFALEYSVMGNDRNCYVVDLIRKSCTFRCFDIDKYACVHAIAAVMCYMKREGRPRDIHVHDLCSKYYSKEVWALAYHRTIYPVPPMSEWIILEEIKEKKILPPFYTKKRGRKQEKRFLSAGEKRRKTSNRRVNGRRLADWFEPSPSAP